MSHRQDAEFLIRNVEFGGALAHSLLYAGDQLAALVEQQRLQMLITLCATSAVTLSDAEFADLQRQIRIGLGLDGGAQ